MKQFFDRRKHNFNLLIMAILLFLFILQIYNQRLILNIHDHTVSIENKIDKYFAPVEDVELPRWEEEP